MGKLSREASATRTFSRRPRILPHGSLFGVVLGVCVQAGFSAGCAEEDADDLRDKNGGDDVRAPTSCDWSAPPGEVPLMRLSRKSYSNTVRDLLNISGLGSLAENAEAFAASMPDDSAAPFRGLDNRVVMEHVQAQFNVASTVGNALESDPKLLAAAAGECAKGESLTDACANEFLLRFGKRALRRPLTAEENASYRALAAGKKPAEGIRALTMALLMSPSFVNQPELAGKALGSEQFYEIDGYAVASRLSYTFWHSMPDDALLAAADDGSLATDAGFQRQLDRVFADPRTHETLWEFWNEWFALDKFTGFSAQRPGFKALAEGEHIGEAGHDHWKDMVQEVRDLTDLYAWKTEGSLEGLLTTDVSVTRSSDLAHLYGVQAWSGSGDYPRFTEGRAGVLQRAALLASNLEQTNPFHRGAVVRRAVLCDGLASPDPNALPPSSLDTPPLDPKTSTRKRFAAKVENNTLCSGCHASFSDIGYALEQFDALGRFRKAEKVFDEQSGKLLAELPIDARAVVRITSEDTSAVSGAGELNKRIVGSTKVSSCMTKNYFRFATRREPTKAGGDSCVSEALTRELANPSVGLATVFKHLAKEPNFRQRKVGAQ